MRHASTGISPTNHRRGAQRILGVLACAAAIAACGSSSKPNGTASAAGTAAGIKFADCMRANGVPNFPDPGSGGGIHIQAGSGINPLSPSLKAARTRCAKLLPGGGPGNGHPSAQEIARTRQVSECMRQHGVTGFPDPTLTPPTSPAGYSVLEDRGGVILAVPDRIDVGSPAFKQAGAACGFS